MSTSVSKAMIVTEVWTLLQDFIQPFQTIEIQIPYEKGLNPYSGFFDLIEARELIAKEGNRYVYTDLSGQVHKYFRKEWNRNENQIMDLVMSEFNQKTVNNIGVLTTEEEN